LLAPAHARDVDRGDGAAQAFGVVAAVEVLGDDVVERHLLRPHQVAQPHLMGLEASRPRHGIHRQLDREAHARSRDATVGQDRALVGRDRRGAAAVRAEIVRPRQQARNHAGLERGRSRIDRIGAGIDPRFALDAEEAAVGIGIRGDQIMVLAAVRVGGKMLAVILDPAHGMAELEREPGQRDFLAAQ
jgi:hypothetical protein